MRVSLFLCFATLVVVAKIIRSQRAYRYNERHSWNRTSTYRYFRTPQYYYRVPYRYYWDESTSKPVESSTFKPNNSRSRVASTSAPKSVRRGKQSDLIHFPAVRPARKQRRRLLLPDLDKDGKPLCVSSPVDTFCENVTHYPKVDLRNEINYSANEFKNIFGDSTEDVESDEGVSGRTYDLGEASICKSRQRLIFPKMAKNADNKWVYVVNDETYTQAVVADVCEDVGKPCEYLENSLPEGLHSRCIQKYSTKRLLALSATEKTYVDKFKFPSCCACYVKSPIGRTLHSSIEAPLSRVNRKQSTDSRESNRSRRGQTRSSGIIVFPDENPKTPKQPSSRMHRPNTEAKTADRVKSDFDATGTPLCLSSPNDTFCEKVADYPQIDFQNEISMTLNEFKNLFGDKEEEIISRKSYFDDELGEERVCKRRQRLIYPKMARNADNKWVYVVNDETYTQAIVSEICENEGKPCSYLENNLPPGLSSRCVQKYSSKRLLALSANKKTYVDKFEFPSCCACYVKSPFGRSKT